MFELKMWDIQMRVTVELGRELCKLDNIHRIECHNANTPYLTAELGKDNPVYITIHIYKKVFQIRLSGSHDDLKVCYHTEGNVINSIVDKLNELLPKTLN